MLISCNKNSLLYFKFLNIKFKSNLIIEKIKNKISCYWIKCWVKVNYLALKFLFLIFLLSRLYFAKYFFIGLGFKMFVYKRKLFVWVGLTHYTILTLPVFIKIYTKKKRIYIISKSRQYLKLFLNMVRKIKKKDIYRGKGLLEVKSYKNFIKMKIGKRKQ